MGLIMLFSTFNVIISAATENVGDLGGGPGGGQTSLGMCKSLPMMVSI